MFLHEIEEYKRRNGFQTFRPKAVMFDMDGVLYDSMPNHAYSWHTSMAHFGIEMPESDAYTYEGMRGVETIRMMCRQQWGREISDDEAQRMYDEKARIFATCPTAQVMPGVMALQRMMKECGMKIVVVTGSGQHTLLEKLASDFEGLVDPTMIVSSFDVKHGKPNPEPYLKGLQKAEAEPWEAIVVENAPLGVRAGVAARVFTIGVNTGPLPDKALTDEGASLVFPDMPSFSERWQGLRECW